MDAIITIFTLIVLRLSIIIHEIAHGSVAFYLGDPTARDAGRLTLNPLPHLDMFGSIIVPGFLFLITGGAGPIFGWTKPVPINPYNFRDQKWGTLKVSIAGPLVNFLIAIIFSLIIRFLALPLAIGKLFEIIILYNFAWGLFNLVPIPPLDGYHILFALLPEKLRDVKVFLRKYSFVLLVLFIYFGSGIIFFGAASLYSFFSGRLFF